MTRTTNRGLDAGSKHTLPIRKIIRLEYLRQYEVPRFLFRAFHTNSGGGPSKTINNTMMCVPHAYMNSAVVQDFYNTSEKRLSGLTTAHWQYNQELLSPYSSWSASLHLVLCYANACANTAGNNNDAYVAVMDTENQISNVKVWHVTHLLDGYKDHPTDEYLAFGTIQGPGYKAVPFRDIQYAGLDQVFSELASQTNFSGWRRKFGHKLRKQMFLQQGFHPNWQDLYCIRRISDLFDEFWLPVATALLCVRPQPWAQRGMPRSAPSNEELSCILQGLGITVKPYWLNSNAAWLWQPTLRPVQLYDSDPETTPGIRQWIDLLYAIACSNF